MYELQKMFVNLTLLNIARWLLIGEKITLANATNIES